MTLTNKGSLKIIPDRIVPQTRDLTIGKIGFSFPYMLLTQLQTEIGSLPVLFPLLAKCNINHCALWINSKTPGPWNTNTDAHLTNFNEIFFVNDEDTEQ